MDKIIDKTENITAAEDDAETPHVAGARILVVDDEEPIRRLIRKLLVREGYEVIGEAESGEQALELCRTLTPDLITMDINMKGMDGLDATREIRKILPNVKVIVITAMAKPSNVATSMKMGAVNFLPKPFENERFLNIVRHALGGA